MKKRNETYSVYFVDGTVIKQARVNKGWQETDLARACDLSSSTVHNVEEGNKQPSIETLFRLCTALKIHPGSVFKRKEKEKPC